MSLIFGINLCDRIYLSADVRLTSLNPDGTIDKFKDKLIKIVPLSKSVSVVAAGDAAMAAFIVKKLKKLKLTELNIRETRSNVKELICPLIDKYWKDINKQASVCLIFGGLNTGSRKDLTNADIYQKVKEFSENDKDNVAMDLKPALFNIMMLKGGQPLRYPEPSDSHVFAVKISPPSGYEEIDANWGEYLAYGANGITKEEIPKIMFGRLEFSQKGDKEMGMDNAIITVLMNEVAQKRKEPTIGGPITTVMMKEGQSGLITGQIGRIDPETGIWELVSEIIRQPDETFYSKDKNGTLRRLIPLDQYKDFGSLQL